MRRLVLALLALALALAAPAATNDDDERAHATKCGTQRFGGCTEFPVTNCPVRCAVRAMRFSHIVYLHREGRYACCCRAHDD